MSEQTSPAASPARARPSSVTVSSYLLYLVAALQVIGVAVALSVLGTFQKVYKEAFAGTDMAGGEGFATATIVGTAVFGLIVAIALVVLAIFNNRGKNASRIATWVVGGLFVCCSGAGLALNAAGSAMSGTSGSTGNGPDQAEVQRRLEEALPSWYTPVSTILGVISVIALLVALILLALPASNEFFRKPQQMWEPPVPGSAYPPPPGSTYPSYPSAPANPTTPPSPPSAPANPTTPTTPPSPPSPPSAPADPPVPPSS
ncbi:hypothetical protein [Micromonospora sp. NPDC049679]|uniref:hypothetical protein n=1 Tax=Micromonospora sp. NPDC049679 TaxID=3155920 RepID=UPI0033D0A41B